MAAGQSRVLWAHTVGARCSCHSPSLRPWITRRAGASCVSVSSWRGPGARCPPVSGGLSHVGGASIQSLRCITSEHHLLGSDRFRATKRATSRPPSSHWSYLRCWLAQMPGDEGWDRRATARVLPPRGAEEGHVGVLEGDHVHQWRGTVEHCPRDCKPRVRRRPRHTVSGRGTRVGRGGRVRCRSPRCRRAISGAAPSRTTGTYPSVTTGRFLPSRFQTAPLRSTTPGRFRCPD
jgi:hypothetical protein